MDGGAKIAEDLAALPLRMTGFTQKSISSHVPFPDFVPDFPISQGLPHAKAKKSRPPKPRAGHPAGRPSSQHDLLSGPPGLA